MAALSSATLVRSDPSPKGTEPGSVASTTWQALVDRLAQGAAILEMTGGSAASTGTTTGRIVYANPAFLAFTGLTGIETDTVEATLACIDGGLGGKRMLMLQRGTTPPFQTEVQDWALEGAASPSPALRAVLLQDMAVGRLESHLRAGLDTINDGVAVFDERSRLVFTNRRFPDFYPELSRVMRLGMTFEAILREGVALGEFPEAIGREAEWIAARMALFNTSGGSFDQMLADGRWLRVRETRTADGWTIGLRTDITAERLAAGRLHTSERLFRTLSDASPVGIFRIDTMGRLSYANAALQQMTGRSLPDLKGLGWTMAVNGEELHQVTTLMREAVARGGDFQHEIRVMGRWSTLLAAAERDAEGKLVGFIGTVIDIHAQRCAEAQLRESEERYRRIVDASQEGILVHDTAERITFVNDCMASILGQPRDTLIGQQVRDVIDPEAYAFIQTRMVRRRQGVSEQYDLRLQRPDGQTTWLLVSATPMTDAAGTVTGALAMVVDITDRQEAQRAQARYVAELEDSRRLLQETATRLAELAERYEKQKLRAEESSRAKSRFLSSMSHELRTPLNSILGFSDILRSAESGPAEAELRAFAQDIHDAGTYLLELINDILDMSKIEAGKYALRPGPVQPLRLVEDTVRMVRQHAHDQGLTVGTVAGPDIPERIRADGRALRQVLLNLLSNAMKFTPEGGRVDVRVRTVISPEGVRQLEVAVADTGIGIAPADMQRLGRPFEQIDSELNRRHQGSGLGLALSKSIVELHGGTVRIDSAPGKGTTVSFRIPLVVDY